MHKVLIEIKRSKRISILRCKKIHEKYYLESNWIKFNKIKFNDKKKLITMIFSDKPFKIKGNALINL